MDRNDFEMMPETPTTTADDAATAVAEPPPEAPILPISCITSMDQYLQNYGRILGRKAIHSLAPLHIPQKDPLPDFDDIPADRQPFPCQAHVVAASVRMMNEMGSGFIVGEMGTGKTLLGITSIHKHAEQSRNRGGSGGNYRALVLCPDHLIGKWCREIQETLPDATIMRFGPQGEEVVVKKKRGARAEKPEAGTRRSLRDTISLLDKREGNRWSKPRGGEWYVLGRNQAKWMSDWAGLADPRKGFDGKDNEHGMCVKTRTIGSEPQVDEKGYPVYGKDGRQVMKKKVAQVVCCPACGATIKDKKGVPFAVKDLTSQKKVTQKTCDGRYLQMLPNPEKKMDGLARISPVPSRFADKHVGQDVTIGGLKFVVKECREPLYNYTSRPYRWSLASVMQRKLRRLFKYLIIDEVHEQKSDESAQSMACGKLIGAVDHVLALTGTIIGGYAHHLFPLMLRIAPDSLRDEGFEWGKDLPFAERYGRIDRVVTTTEKDSSTSVSGNVKSMRRSKSGDTNVRKYVRPGVMPTMFGKHLIGNSIFITLEEMADELPDLFEYIGGPLVTPPADSPDHEIERSVRSEAGWNETACDMLPEQQVEYLRVQTILEQTCKELLTKGSMKLLGAYLWTTLDYPDRPFGWDFDPEVMKAAMSDENQVPGLLGQSFLKNFDHKFEADTETLVLTKLGEDGAETDRIKLSKDGGIYWLDVTFNGGKTLKLAYDTGASTISLSLGMANELGLKPRVGDQDVMIQVADGSTVKSRMTNLSSVQVGKFVVKNVEATVVPPGKLTHTVGYWDKPGSRKIENWMGVVTPRSLSEDVVYPKEQALIDICKKQKADGTQTWVYVQMTGKRNIQPRLKALLEKEGLKVGVLRSDDVEPIQREEWIARHGRDYDVMISHPQLVSTGLDLFSKAQGGHNYSTLVFYETGYNLFTMRQAARRAWRIGQPRDCRVYYLYYKDTMQHKAMSLMSRKMAAAQALEGEFSEDGLAAMAGEDNLQMALAKSLSERIDSADMQRSWGKVKSGPKKKLVKPGDALKSKEPVKPSPLDGLPIELQMIAESLIESQTRPIPEETLTELSEISKMLAAADQGVEVTAKDDESFYDPTSPEEYASKAIRLYNEGEEDGGDDELPELTEEILAKMFSNMMVNGMWGEAS